jgi:hypothetical protein
MFRLVRRLYLRFGVPLFVAALVVAAVAVIHGRSTDRIAEAAGQPLVDPKSPRPKIPSRPNAVMIVMDEFPVDAMLDRSGQIDAVRYPNFASLAATGTWFRNATTVYDSTTRAIPEVLDGMFPKRRADATYRSHPRTVYDLFGRRGYRIVRNEEATSICPPRYCRGAARRRPAILPLLARGRRERLDRWINSINPGRPTFYLKHVLLPHGPYMFLPSGRQTRRTFQDPIPGMNSPRGFGDRFLTDHNQQRMLLQIAFMDRQLGKMFTRMRKNGTFDTSLIAITADHGMAFEVGVKDRRTATRGNIDEIAPVPLFIKAPGQRRGRTDRSYVRTIDVVPTMADVLNFKLPYKADGRSAFSRAIRRRRSVRMIKRNFSGTLTISGRSLERRRRALVRRKLALFGAGDFRTLYTGLGPNRKLLGRRAADLRPAGLGSVRATIVGGADMRNVSPGSIVLPTQVGGPVQGGRRGAKREIAVAVNGRIEAVGRTFYLQGSRQESFAVMVPEIAMRPGRNVVEVFEVSGRGTSLRLLARN